MVHTHDSMRVAPFGYLRINACLQLPAAFRSLPRPSSAPGAKAFALRPYSLDRLPLFACFDSPANDKNFYLPFRVLQSFLLYTRNQ